MKIPFPGFLSVLALWGALFSSKLQGAVITENSKLVASDPAPNDQFGIAVTIQDRTIVVGSWHDDNSILAAGAAYVFRQSDNGSWTQLKKLVASDAGAGDEFGAAVSLSGLTLAVGASGDDDTGSEAGAVYIFGQDEGGPTAWGETVKLVPDNASGRMGAAVALSGDTLVVGAPGDRSPGTDTGAAYIFERNRGGNNIWGLTKKLLASDRSAGAQFGTAVAIEQDTIIVGAPRQGSAAGAAYLFARHQGGTDNWGEIKKLLATDASSSNNFGRAVAIHEQTVLVGAPALDRPALPGAAYLFERASGGANAWGQVAKVQGSISSPGAGFGSSAVLFGAAAVVGSPTEARAGDRAGLAFIFGRNAGGTTNWGETQILAGTDTSALFQFGQTVAGSGQAVVVGAPGDRSAGVDTGSAYVFALTEIPLAIRRLDATTALVSWATTGTAVNLETTASLQTPLWTNVVTPSNGYVATFSGSSRFFRLSRPAPLAIEFVPVGNPGNVEDTTGLGGLGLGFQIGRYEVTNDDYVRFLNAIATLSDAFGLYSPAMTADPRGGIMRSGSAGSFHYASKPFFSNKPVNFVSYYDALRFANWLHNGQPHGGQNSGTTEDGAYPFSGATSVGARRVNAKVWLPSESEWYKAAYFDPTRGANGGYWHYPTRSDTAPALATADDSGNINNGPNNVANYDSGAIWNGQEGNLTSVGTAGIGSRSYYGAADMGGNLAEWTETLPETLPGIRGGSWADFESGLESSNSSIQEPLSEVDTVGFRVARP